MGTLENKVAVVTGASRGIGKEIARELARSGCTVVLAARSAGRIQDIAEQLAGDYGVPTLAVPTNVSQQDDVVHLMEEAAARYGGVDILVNNAGVGLFGSIDEMDLDVLRRVFEVNLYGALAAIQAVTPMMRRRGGGTIVNVGSIVGKFPSPLGGGYSASKYALHAASRAARIELKRDNINVMLVCPGITATQFSQKARIGVAGVEGGEGESQSPVKGVSPQAVARRIVRAIRRGEREVYVTWFDRAVVLLAQLLPSLFDWGLVLLTSLRRWRFKRWRRKQSLQAVSSVQRQEEQQAGQEKSAPIWAAGLLAAGVVVWFWRR